MRGKGVGRWRRTELEEFGVHAHALEEDAESVLELLHAADC